MNEKKIIGKRNEEPNGNFDGNQTIPKRVLFWALLCGVINVTQQMFFAWALD